MININQGKNEALAKRCRTLTEYSAFIAKVREYEQETNDKTESMTQAIKYCLEHDILKEFLEKHSTEVINMLYMEWDQEAALAEGVSIELVQKITGLDLETVKKLAQS